MNALEYYITILIVYGAVDAMAAWGLNLQFGVTGVINFAYIVFQAAGAYTAAIVTLGPAQGLSTQQGGFQTYLGGTSWPYPLPLVAAMVVGGLLSAVVGLIGLPRLRRDYQALVMLIVSLIATTVMTVFVGIANGSNGLALIPAPLKSSLGVSPDVYNWLFVAWAVALCIGVYVIVQRLTFSPLGRSLRGVRENPELASNIGKNVTALRLTVFIAGGAIAALSGAILVEFIGAWSPDAWQYSETFALFTAIVIGGKGNNLGVLIGAVLVGVLFQEAVRFLPTVGYYGLTESLQWIAISALWLLFLWFRPRGVLPEKKREYVNPAA